MGDTVIFIDGEYVRKIFINQSYRVNVPLLVSEILSMCKIENDSLLRVYYYSSPPFQSTNPTPDEKTRYAGFQKFMAFLEMQENFEIKLGRTEKRGETFSQKMVDVLLSIDLVELSAKSKIRTAILVAGDSDFVPAVKKAKDNGVRVILCCSDNRNEYHINLWKESDRRISITVDTMKKCSGR